MNSFINKIIFRDNIKNMILFFTLYIFSIFEFLLIVLLQQLSYSKNISHYVVALTLLLSLFLFVYMNMFIIEDSYQQIAIMMVNGKSANAITKHIMKKYFFILLCVVISGSLSGYIINTLIFKNSSQINIYHIFYMILLFFIKFIYIFIISLCQLKNIKYKLINYINQISKIDNKVGYFSSFIVDKEKKSFPYIKLTAICMLLIIFIGATKMIITKNINTIDFITGLTGLTISFLLITKLLFPILFDFFHRHLLKHKVFMIAFNDFITLYHTTFTLISISIVVLPFMIYFLITASQTAIYLICYSMIHISLILCYFFRY